MKDNFRPINRTPASFQHYRFPAELQDGFIPVDERTLPDLITALRAYSNTISYYNLDKEPEGDWHHFFLKNEALLLAEPILFNENRIKNEFIEVQRFGNIASVLYIWNLIKKIDKWIKHAQLSTSQSGLSLYQKTSRLIKGLLSQPVSDITELGHQLDIISAEEFASLETIWKKEGSSFKKEFNTLKTNSDQEREKKIYSTFHKVVNLYSFLRKESNKVFFQSIEEQIHSPSAGLLLSFLKTYHSSQTVINQFPKKLHDFYYKDILKNHSDKNGYDRIFLKCDLKPDCPPVCISNDFRFSAGKNEQLKDRLYVTESPSNITGSTLKAIKTVFLQRHPLVSPENINQSVTRIKYNNVLNQLHSSETLAQSLFGYDDGLSGSHFGHDRNPGIIISSPILFMKQGYRHVQLKFRLSDRFQLSLFAQPELIRLIAELKSQQKKSRYDPWLFRNIAKTFVVELNPLIDNSENKLFLARKLFHAVRIDITDNIGKVETHPDALVNNYFNCLYNVLLTIQNKWSFRRLHHQLICNSMMGIQTLSKKQREAILHKARQLWQKPPEYCSELKAINRTLQKSSSSLFHERFRNAFILKLTSETGWLSIYDYSLSLSKPTGSFTLSFDIESINGSISQYDPEIHDKGRPETGLPLLKLEINPRTSVYPYSYLKPFTISQIHLAVTVKKFTQLTVQNDYGLQDHRKTFQPYGPLPESGATLLIGGYEFARKNLTSLTLNLNWRQLPTKPEGFSAYYTGYDCLFSNNQFKVILSCSANGRWHPGDKKQKQQEHLFTENPESKILSTERKIHINLPNALKPLPFSVAEDAYTDLNQLHNGHFRLELAAGEHAFGHKLYPKRMAEVLTHNSRSRKPQPLPEPPLTPEIDSLSIDYRAEETISLNTLKDSTTAIITEASIYHITPLGYESVSSPVPLFPLWEDFGNLYIGFDKHTKATSFNLFFHLKEDASHASKPLSQHFNWRYFSASGWKTLPAGNIISNSTHHFTMSGIVTLNLPGDLHRHLTLEPENCFWLCLSASSQLDNYASLKGIYFDVISVKSISDSTKLSLDSENPISSNWQPLSPLAGLSSVQQRLSPFENHHSETDKHASTRLYEQLRHKGNALCGWDYERLVLQQFPSLFAAKCFSATRPDSTEPAPGHVLLVAVPAIETIRELFEDGYLISAFLLQKISETLAPLMPESVKLTTSNPVYEIIQVRCAVRFQENNNYGQLLHKLNDAICLYLSPWSDIGCQIEFGWTIRAEDLQSFIRNLDYVDTITQFSMLKILQTGIDPKKFRLTDSAESLDLQASVPWSLPIPAQQHLLSICDTDTFNDVLSVPASISNLEIGHTFIIKG